MLSNIGRPTGSPILFNIKGISFQLLVQYQSTLNNLYNP